MNDEKSCNNEAIFIMTGKVVTILIYIHVIMKKWHIKESKEYKMKFTNKYKKSAENKYRMHEYRFILFCTLRV